MRAVVQRVKRGKVTVEGKTTGEIKNGLLVLLGVGEEDTLKDVDYLCEKIVKLRIFEDEDAKMNLSLLDIKGELLVVSQFTLFGDCRKGRRPNFMAAAGQEKAEAFYEAFVERSTIYGIKVATGQFGGDMEVDLINQGPVTILIDSKKTF